MAANIQKIDLVDIELNSGNIHRSWFAHAIGMKDNKADAFGVRVFRNGQPVKLTSVSVQGHFKNPQGTNIAITSGNTVDTSGDGNIAYVVLPQACYEYDGQFCLAVKLVGGGITGTMRIVDGVISNTNIGGDVTPTEAVPTYQEVLAVYEEALEVIDSSVRYDESQGKTATEQAQARSNIDAVSTTDAVRYDGAQTNTDLRKAQARSNIDAANVDDIAPVFNTSGKSLLAGSLVLDPVYKTLYRLKADVAQGTSWSTSLGDKVDLSDELISRTSALKSAMNVMDAVINGAHNFINYGYDTVADLSPSGGTGASAIGIKRNREYIILNASTSPSEGTKIKVNGSVVRTMDNGLVNNWTGISLTNGHQYKITNKYISGSSNKATPNSVSVYKQGAHATIGTATIDGNDYIRTFTYDGTPVNIALYVESGTTYSNYTTILYLEDITGQVDGDTVARSEIDSLYSWNKEITKTINYDYDTIVDLAANASQTTASTVGIKREKNLFTINTANTPSAYVKIKICGSIIRTNDDGVVDAWTGINLQTTHKYRIKGYLLSGTISGTIALTAYQNGSHASIGYMAYENDGSYYTRIFTPSAANVTLALYIAAGTTLSNAKLLVTLEDMTAKTEYLLLDKTKTVELFRETEYDTAQSLVIHEGYAYIYLSYSESIRKINLSDGTNQSYNIDLGHGNGMVYYNGYIYASSMNENGTIYKVDPSTMTIVDNIRVMKDGSAILNSGIAFDDVNERFILKTNDNNGFTFCDTSFNYISQITRSYISGATGQGISCDKNFIYVIESEPNHIHVYNYDGTYYGQVSVQNEDEPENIYYDNGVWYMLSNVHGGGYYLDAVQFYKNLDVVNIAGIAALFGHRS